MADPREGVSADGTIVTGAARHRVPTPFEPLLSVVSSELAEWPDVSVYLYGSVATGQALVGLSDVDLLTVDLPPGRATDLAAELSDRFTGLCRSVEIGPARTQDLRGGSDEAYGLRVFLRHYCVHLGGPDLHSALPAYPADARAARGFNGDIGQHLVAWRHSVAGDDPAVLGRRVARKTLLAVAGLVSVVASTWTTDRARAARDQGRRRPHLADDLSALLSWSSGDLIPDRERVDAALRSGGVVGQVAAEFAEIVGLWPEQNPIRSMER